MNPEDIKIGERVSLSGYIANKTDKHFYITFHTGFNEYTKIKFEIPSLVLYQTTPENGIKNTESTSKYDPRRKFRKGDKVRFKEHLGRKSLAYCDEIITLEKDEQHGLCFWTDITPYGDIVGRSALFCFLELVTPVEELEPYFVGESENSYDIFRKNSNGNQLRSSFWWKHNPTPELIELSKTNAKRTAQAECERLNAEYRKEQK